MNKWINRILWILAILLLLLQVVIAAFYTKPVTDSLVGLKDATSVYEGGKIILSSPVMSLWGLIGRIGGILPIRLALDILPFIIIPLCYFAYVFLARTLFKESLKTPLTLVLTELLNIYGFQSEALSPCTLLLGWYRGEAILIHLVLPLLLAFYIRWRDKHPAPERTYEEYPEDEMKHKILNVRNLSIAFAAFAVIVLGAVFVLNQKINNLHNATISLQNIIEDKGEFIEFKGALGDSFKGYVVIDKDDNVTVIFGGNYDDGEALLDLLSKYDKKVTSWYLEKDGEQGAFEYCRENGVSIEHIYSIGGIEEIK